jgi:hypothetical protein
MNSPASRVNTTDYMFRLKVAKAAWRKRVNELVQEAALILENGRRHVAAVRGDITQNGVWPDQLRRNIRDEARIKADGVKRQAQAYRNRADGVGELEVLYDKNASNDVAFRSEYQELINQARDLKLLVYAPTQTLALSSTDDLLD